MTTMRRRLTHTVLAVLAAVLLTLVTAPAALAGCHYGGDHNGTGAVLTGDCGGSNGQDGGSSGGGDGGGPWNPTGPPAPAYHDYYTPACSLNGPPPASGDLMCMAAASACRPRGIENAIFMRHYRQQVSPTVGEWEFVGTECRGPDEPAEVEPQVTSEMVLDAAFAAAPKPTAMVQPGNRSYVNVPNNYYADAQDQTVPVEVLGHQIAVRFTVTDVSWDFGDGTSASGKGVKDADVGAPGAVEHGYTQQGSYDITATSTLGVAFTLPNGQAVNMPAAFLPTSPPVTLPVGEIQTRVDSTS